MVDTSPRALYPRWVTERIEIVRPLRVALLTRRSHGQVAAWMNEPAIYEPLDLVPTISPHSLAQRQLIIRDRDGTIEPVPVVLYELTDAREQLLGFAISYTWDEDPSVRELDLAMPGLRCAHPFAALELVMRSCHAVFVTERAVELRAALRGGAGRHGATRAFQSFGAQTFEHPPMPNLRGSMFRLLPEWFYASRPAQRCGLQPGRP